MRNKIISLLFLLVFALSFGGCPKRVNEIVQNPSVETSKTDEKKQEDETADEVVEELDENKTETVKTEPAEAPEGHTHSYSAEVVNATCTKDGYTLNVCECGDKYRADTVQKIGHNFGGWETVKAATTLKKGTSERKCTICGKTETKELNKLSLSHKHSYEKKVVAPTCKAGGYTSYTCKCGDSYIDNETVKTEHSYASEVIMATCTAEGYTNYKCKCGDAYIGNRTSKTGHSYQETNRIEAKCETDGFIEYTCKNCPDSYKTIVEKKGHQFVQSSRVEATITNDGYIEYSCSKCTSTKKETLPRIDVDKTYTIDLGSGKTTTVVGHFDNQMADEIFGLLNTYRTEKGLYQLSKGSSALQEAANIRAYEIVNKFEHYRPNGERALISFNPTTDCCAENIAKYQKSAVEVMNSWKNSTSHNKTMLTEDAESVSIGVFAEKKTSGSGIYYSYHFVQLFAW